MEISTVRTREYVELKATLYAMDNQDYLCEKCIGRFRKRKDAEAMIAKVQERNACKKTELVARQYVEDLSFHRCVGNFYSHGVMALMGTYYAYKEGHLPYPGSLLEQPNKIMEAFSVIEDWKTKKELAEMKAQRERMRSSRGR